MSKDLPAPTVTSETELREILGTPMKLAEQKILPRLDEHFRRFIALSPFLCLGTTGPDGRADVSPRGDLPGFVQVPDDRTLLIPDRPGNRRLDSMTNLLATSAVGLLFFVPGMDETLRVNGRASIVTDPDILATMAVGGKTPKAAIRVDIDEAFVHCGKALKRARLWDPTAQIDRKTFPSIGKIVFDQLQPPDWTVESLDEFTEENYRNELY